MKMTLGEVKAKCPKAYKKLTEYTKEYLLNFQKKQVEALEGEEFTLPPISDKMAEMATDGLLYGNQSQLGEFFSDNDVDISLTFQNSDKSGKHYSYQFSNSRGIYSGQTVGRTATELRAYLRAFEILENEL